MLRQTSSVLLRARAVQAHRPSPLLRLNEVHSIHERRDDKTNNTLGANLQQIRAFHATPKSESVVLACVGVAGAAFGASMALDLITKRQAEQAAAAAAQGADAKDKETTNDGNPFSLLFNNFLGAKTFYQGGF